MVWLRFCLISLVTCKIGSTSGKIGSTSVLSALNMLMLNYYFFPEQSVHIILKDSSRILSLHCVKKGVSSLTITYNKLFMTNFFVVSIYLRNSPEIPEKLNVFSVLYQCMHKDVISRFESSTPHVWF